MLLEVLLLRQFLLKGFEEAVFHFFELERYGLGVGTLAAVGVVARRPHHGLLLFRVLSSPFLLSSSLVQFKELVRARDGSQSSKLSILGLEFLAHDALDECLEYQFVNEDLPHRVQAVDVVLAGIHDLHLLKLTRPDQFLILLLRLLLHFQEHFWVHGAKLLVECLAVDV